MTYPKKIIIVGGGTAGWMTAAALAKTLPNNAVTLIESDLIGTVGVGEATIPHLRFFNERIGINEHEFMSRCSATYKLGIDFRNWNSIGSNYIHPFGEFGKEIDNIPFHHFWSKAKKMGISDSIFDYSLPVVAAKMNRFDYPSNNTKSLLSTYSYAFHIDASKYALMLREHCENEVNRIEGKIDNIRKDVNGNIQFLELANGEKIEGDFFIDCSGFKALLIEETLNTGFEDWSHWLRCDRAIAVPTESISPPKPYTVASAHKAGWQWEIPLQHRTGNGIVYASEFMSDDEAASTFDSSLKGRKLAAFNHLKFKAGKRKKGWKKNCVAIGLSSGFLEPLESTSIFLIQAAIMKLVELFPTSQNYTAQASEYNRCLDNEYNKIKDFLILHYHATQRDDSNFWKYCKNMEIPESLKTFIEAFKANGYTPKYQKGLFLTPSWVAVLIGQGIIPNNYHHNAELLSSDKLTRSLDNLKSHIHKTATSLPEHSQAISKHASEKTPWPAAALSLYGVFS